MNLVAAELFSVQDKTALVTGGATGIGRMIAKGLLVNGAKVVIASRKESACRRTAEELADFGDCSYSTVDVTDIASIRELASFLSERDDKLDILINNSGTGWAQSLADYPVRGWDKVFDVNVRAPFFLIQSLLSLLRAAATPESPARIVNVGSVAGIHTRSAGNYAYGSSKAAVHHLTKIVAGELANEHITVNALAPGPFPGQMMTETMLETLVKTVPLGRAGDENDIVGAILYLCSRAGNFVTGAVIPVDGGRLLRL